MKGMDWYYNKILELIKVDVAFSNDEVIVLVQDCDDFFHIEKSEGYIPHVCDCGVKWEIRYMGTKRDILREVECDLLEYKYGD